MKKLMHIIPLMLFLSFVTASTGCAQCDRTIQHNTAIFLDVTDGEHLAMLRKYMSVEFEQLKLFIENSKAFTTCNRATVMILPINDKGQNRPLISASPVVIRNMTKTQIDREVKPGFFKSIVINLKTTLDTDKNGASEYNQTRIYEPLCLLLKEHGGTKYPLHVIIYSDLLEHNLTTFYQGGKALPVEKTLQVLEKSCHCELPEDLSFLRIHLITFRTKSNDRLIGAARNFWQSVFTARGARVKTGTGLQPGSF